MLEWLRTEQNLTDILGNQNSWGHSYEKSEGDWRRDIHSNQSISHPLEDYGFLFPYCAQ